ncbi:hypothetical protein [Kordia jejudonensis]|uniref:hypothetical protein n=1 Tax=Kordia jejudonensis TaxID=1348245 RepID=UPI0006295F6E|nr:hypothetical protein [Kordia jejudonensis]
MTKQIQSIIFILTVTCIFSCTDKKNGVNIAKSKIEIDTIQVKNFLKDPRNNLAINKLDYETECTPSETKNPTDVKVISRKYYDCKYIYKGEKIAEMKSSIFKTDSTWTFGTNGFEIHHFESDQEFFPLKNGLSIGSTVEDFQHLFGMPKKLMNTYLYNFEFELFSSKLILEYDKNMVTKITVINTRH